MNSLRTLFVLTLVGLLAACGQSEDAPVSSGGSGGSGHSSANRGYKKADKKAKLSDLENADLQAIQDIFAASNISNMEVRQNAKNWSYKAGFEPSCSAYQSFYNSQRLLYADIAPQIQALKLQTVLGKELVATLAPALDKIADASDQMVLLDWDACGTAEFANKLAPAAKQMAEANRVYAKAIVQYSDAIKSHEMFTLADETSVLHTATDTEKALKYLQGKPEKGHESSAPAK
ncbi:hypothetical protein [Kingella sp. (in: b-proteobacteria)]|uniref:hypothetical protein n=1 Tax=Kingella sp. (in: b-proteobacteria) TaxID=2020713 RepID=UPI0026DC863E|nr:hypothetical protein [Kingella sp. (in: b-proteobacteria)]MDO4658273.1 hypothetical protein [Kingella sp. (in: b-proteobacteria)]